MQALALWTSGETREIILLIFAQITGLMILYFKLANKAAARVESLKKEIKDSTKQIQASNAVTAREVNGLLRALIDSIGVPAWVKIAITNEDGDTIFRMLHLNRQYEDAFGVRAEDYKAKTDFEMWDHATAAKFYQNDLEVFGSGIAQTYVEWINGKPMRFRKCRVQDRETGKIKAIYGQAIDCNDPENCPVHTSKKP